MASDAAHEWLARINEAARHLEYEGIFIYQHDSQLETMHIFHKVENGSSKERLVSLNGTPREIIRDKREVRCYWPDMKSIVVEYRRADNKSFPSLLPEHLGDLDEYYNLQTGGIDRIANRQAQLILVRPADNYRYGYHLWADKQTGLLLKAGADPYESLTDREKQVLKLVAEGLSDNEVARPVAFDKFAGRGREEGDVCAGNEFQVQEAGAGRGVRDAPLPGAGRRPLLLDHPAQQQRRCRARHRAGRPRAGVQ